MKKERPIHVVIADDHAIMREGLTAVISREPDMEIVAQACDWPEAVKQVIRNRPEIAVLDLHMRGMEPADAVATIREKSSSQIVIFSAFSTNEKVYQVFSQGARGYVLKGESGREDLLQCIRAVSRGEMWIHPVAASRLAERMSAPNLTRREMEVLRLMVTGKSNKEIGSSLDVTEGTVKVHVNHILGKLGVSGRVEAIMVAVRRGFVQIPRNLQDPTQNSASHDGGPSGPHPVSGTMTKAIDAPKTTPNLPDKK